jgi:predicted HicB family RNase H-like nuclease
MAPNQPKTPVSNFRIPAELKERAAAKAASEGKTLTDVVVEHLREYADKEQGKK